MDNQNDMDLQKTLKLLEINKILTKSLQLEEILNTVRDAASELISVSDTLIIYLYNESTNKLYLAKGKGIHYDKLKKVAFSPGESIAGKVFKEKSPKLFASEKEIDIYMSNMSPDNYRHYYEGVYRRKIKSIFCVPILHRDRCLGVMAVNNFKQNGVFTKADMQVIEILAGQSAIAIENSNSYYRLKENNKLLSQSITIHNRFYKLIIDGEGIQEIISLLETITNSHFAHHQTVFYEENDNIFPIKRGNELLGLLQMEKPFQEYSSMDRIAIKHASLTIALVSITDNVLFEKELQFRQEVFQQLRRGVSRDDLRHLLHYMNWNENKKVQCILIEGKKGVLWDGKELKDKEWFISSVEAIANSICGKSFVFAVANQVIMLLPKTRENVEQYVIQNVKKTWSQKKDLLFGIGRETTMQKLTTTYEEAVRSIKYARSNSDISVVYYKTLGVERLLHEVDSATLEMYINDKLEGLLDHGKTFIDTLHVYMMQNKNHKETAKTLHIHVNTLYYRLRKIEEILGIDLNNERDWLDLVIAIQLYMASNKN